MAAEFDAERRAFNKLELKRIRQQQAQDKVEPDLVAKLEAKDASLSGTLSNPARQLLTCSYECSDIQCRSELRISWKVATPAGSCKNCCQDIQDMICH